MFVLASFVGAWGLAAWFACAFFAAYIASEKNRCGICWFFWGVLFGPISLITTIGLPVSESLARKDNNLPER